MAKNVNEAITQIVENWAAGKEFFVKLGTVKDIDISKGICIFTSNESDIEIECLLYPYNSKIQIIPKEGSLCVVGFNSDQDPYILSVQEFETIIYDSGENKGIAKIVELTEKLNNLENAFNSLVTKYNSHIHITTATSVTLPVPIVGVISPTISTETTVLTKTVYKDIENEKIKH